MLKHKHRQVENSHLRTNPETAVLRPTPCGQWRSAVGAEARRQDRRPARLVGGATGAGRKVAKLAKFWRARSRLYQSKGDVSMCVQSACVAEI